MNTAMKYTCKKLITLIITLFIVSVATFLAFQIIPGDAVSSMLGTESTPEREEALRTQLGLDKPVPERYVNWIKGMMQGDLGRSYRYSENMNEMMSVSKLIGDKLPVTLTLAFLSFIIIIVVSIPLGILWSGTKNRYLDGLLNIICQISMSVPSFFLGIIIIYIFGLMLKLFTPGNYISYSDDFAGFIGYLIFPAFSIAVPKIAMTARFLRNSMLTELKSDYVRTAYSKGASIKRVMYGHVLKNAMIPVVTFIGIIIAEIVAGSIVVEQVFGLPGIGRLLISSISTRDFPVVQILILYIAIVVILVYFVVDIIYKLIDPRIQ